ncbi:MAG: galactose oxidase-like domain-containing protein [Acidimicrobiia bacterium]
MGFLFLGGHGGNGNFEMVLPRGAGGGAWHWWRDNDDPGHPWHGPTTAFGSEGVVDAVTLIQGNLGPAGNLEVVARAGDGLVYSSRDDGGTWRWKTPAAIPGSGGAAGAPSLVQGSSGATGNFEVVSPLAGGGLAHWWRDNDGTGTPWTGPTPFAGGTPFAAADMVEGWVSGHLEVVARSAGLLVHWWRDGGFAWHSAGVAGSGVTGIHAICQAAASGNYELVAPLAAGGMGHWSANPSAPSLDWHQTAAFGSGPVAAVGLVESPGGNLEVVAMVGDHLQHWWREGGPHYAWHGPTVFWTAPAVVPAATGTCAVPYETGAVGIHAALLKTGKVALWSFTDWDDGKGDSRILDPVTGAQVTPPVSHHLFCSGHALDADGRLVVAGGHHGDVASWHTLEPDVGEWVHAEDMSQGRWYPTCTTLPDGQVLTMSGTVGGGPIHPGNPVNNTVQKFHPASLGGPELPMPSPWSHQFPPHLPTIDLYPFVFVLPSGKLFVHSRNVTRFYDPDTDTWDAHQALTNFPVSRTYPVEGTAVLLPLQPPDYVARILIAGGGGADPETVTSFTPATATAEIMGIDVEHPGWVPAPSMAYPRVMPDAVLLPDGTVLVIGGSLSGKADNGLEPVYPIERFDPATGTWTTLCHIAVPRLYHSTALLLPDASVLIMGKDAINNPDPFHYPEHRAEVFSPPYLHTGPRPVVTTVPDDVHYAQSFSVGATDPAAVDGASLLRPGSVTHSFNMEQRLVGLPVTSRTAVNVTLDAPPGPTVAPPGWYLLFLLSNGVPSVGRFVRLS